MGAKLTAKTLFACVAALILVALLVVYYKFNPLEHELFPKCVVHTLTGIQCPSCGSQRALHSFMHGDFTAAVRYNLFALYSVPYFLLVMVACFVRPGSGRLQRVCARASSRSAVMFYVYTYLGWWILRNLLGL